MPSNDHPYTLLDLLLFSLFQKDLEGLEGKAIIEQNNIKAIKCALLMSMYNA